MMRFNQQPLFKFLPLLLLVLALSCENKEPQSITKSEEPPVDDYSAKIDSLIQATNPRIFNGVILITQKEKTKYAKASGYADFANKTPLTLNDNFRI